MSSPDGTTNSNTPVTATSGAESSSHGRALPCLVRVRSMTYPMMTLVTASMTFEMTGKTTKNSPPNPKTSV